jgi:hypothetical protein
VQKYLWLPKSRPVQPNPDDLSIDLGMAKVGFAEVLEKRIVALH